MIIIIDRILPSIANKSIKFKTKNIAPSFISTFSFFLNHLRITVIYKYTKPNSIIIRTGIKKPKCGANANGMFYPKQSILTKQRIKKEILLLSILNTVVKFYPKVFS